MPESLPAELVELRDRVAAFAEAELRPLEAGLEDDPAAALPDEFARQVRARSRELGLFGMTQPRELGGSEAGPLALTVVREALAAANLRLAGLVLGPTPGVLRAASGELRTRYLEPLLRGELVGAFAFTEPADTPRPTWGTRDGAELVVTGRKAYVSRGGSADFYTALVNVEDGEQPGGTAMVVIDRGTPGVSIERAFRSLEGGGHVELAFEAVRVPSWHVIGEIGEGMPRALGNIGDMRLAMAAEATGLAAWTVSFVEEHLRAPHRSGSPLGDREGVRLRFGEICVEAYAARSMLYRTARLRESGEEAINEVAATKLYTTEAVGRAVDSAVQLVGGQALVVGHPLERLYRRVRSMRIAEGPSDLLRLQIARGRLEFDAGRM